MRKRCTRIVTAFSTALVGTAAVTVLVAGSADATTGPLTGLQSTPPVSGPYAVDNNEWGSSAPESVTVDGSDGFTVTNSSIGKVTNGPPGGYPAIYAGCHWGNCTVGGLADHPVQVSTLIHPGTVQTSWSTTQPGGGAAYDVAYDIWYNQAPTTTGQPNGAEMMVWLNHNGPVQPFGSPVGSAVIDGVPYQVWEGNQGWGDTISYVMVHPATSVSNLNIGGLAADALKRGYIQKSWYLIDVEAGFELWRGGAGLATNSFSVKLNGSGNLKPILTPAHLAHRAHLAHQSHQTHLAHQEALASNLSLETISPSPTKPGTATNITVGFTNTGLVMDSNTTVIAEVLNSAGAVVGSQSWTGQNIAPQQRLSQTYAWTAASPTGNYTIKEVVRDSSGQTLQQVGAGTITVVK
jgi:hypothetical protein